MADVRRFDSNGNTICPCCGKRYKPVLNKRPEDDHRNIQKIFPNATAEEREQLLTGLCSTKCWNKYLGEKTHET